MIQRLLLGVVMATAMGPGFCLASDWTSEDAVLESTFMALLAVDVAQTLEGIERHDEGYHETNLILGSHPSREEVIAYALASAAGHWIITDWLTTSRGLWLRGTVALEAVVIYHNWQIGLNLGF